MTDTTSSLIDKLRAEKLDGRDAITCAHNLAVDACIFIAREHTETYVTDADIERVAVTLSQWRNDKDWLYAQWGSLRDNVKNAYLAQAKAAITAFLDKGEL